MTALSLCFNTLGDSQFHALPFKSAEGRVVSCCERTRKDMTMTIGKTARESRDHMGWPVTPTAQAAYVSNKSLSELENDNIKQESTGSSQRKVFGMYEAYGFHFSDDFETIEEAPDPENRYFLTIDLRYTDDPDGVVADMERDLRAIGYSVVIKRNLQRNAASRYDAIVIHVPPLNVVPLKILLERFLEKYKDMLPVRIRDERNVMLSKDAIDGLFDG